MAQANGAYGQTQAPPPGLRGRTSILLLQAAESFPYTCQQSCSNCDEFTFGVSLIMAVNQVSCGSCEAVLKVPEKYWGKKIKCPSCSSPMSIPAAPSSAGPPRPAAVSDDDFLDEEPKDDFLNMDADSFESGPVLPPKRKKKSAYMDPGSSGSSARGSSSSKGYSSGGGSGGTIGSGILMMVGAVVWFVVGLACGIIFFYPPILFILGLVQVFRGIFSND